jgi:bifunctional oligoribonuclease and PAP phosphatase NrnA
MNKKINFDKKVIGAAWDCIQKFNKITLLTHFRPDGDGVSACAALSFILVKLGKSVETVYPNEPELKFSRQSENLFINKHEQQPDLLIMCDTANRERTYLPEQFNNVPIINIDHHVDNSVNGAFNFVDGSVASACEILYKLLKKWDATLIDTYVAECLLFGILSDTNVFRTQLTNSTTLRIAAELLDKGVNLFELKTELLSNKNPKIINLWGDVFNRVQISKNKKAAWMYITQADLKERDLTLSSLVGFNDFLAEISGIDITLLFYEFSNGQVKVSLRSKEADVNKLAVQFGGGGHKNASGIVSDKPLQELIKEVTAKLGD